MKISYHNHYQFLLYLLDLHADMAENPSVDDTHERNIMSTVFETECDDQSYLQDCGNQDQAEKIIKANLYGDVRTIQLVGEATQITYDELEHVVRQIFPHLDSNDKISVKYYDIGEFMLNITPGYLDLEWAITLGCEVCGAFITS